MARPIRSVLAKRHMFRGGGMIPVGNPMQNINQASGILASSQPLIEAVAQDATSPVGGASLSMAKGGVARFWHGGVHRHKDKYEAFRNRNRLAEEANIFADQWVEPGGSTPSSFNTFLGEQAPGYRPAPYDKGYSPLAAETILSKGNVGKFTEPDVFDRLGLTKPVPFKDRFGSFIDSPDLEINVPALPSLDTPETPVKLSLNELLNQLPEERYNRIFGKTPEPRRADESRAEYAARAAIGFVSSGLEGAGESIKGTWKAMFDAETANKYEEDYWGALTIAVDDMISLRPEFAEDIKELSTRIIRNKPDINVKDFKEAMAYGISNRYEINPHKGVINAAAENKVLDEQYDDDIMGAGAKKYLDRLANIDLENQYLDDIMGLGRSEEQDAAEDAALDTQYQDDIMGLGRSEEQAEQDAAAEAAALKAKQQAEQQAALKAKQDAAAEDVALEAQYQDDIMGAGLLESEKEAIADKQLEAQYLDDLMGGGERPQWAENAEVVNNIEEVTKKAKAEVQKVFANKPGMTSEESKKTVKQYAEEFKEAIPDFEGMSESEKGWSIFEAGLQVMAGQSPHAIVNIAKGLKGLGAEFAKDAKEKRAWNRQVDLSAAKFGLEAQRADIEQDRADRRKPYFFYDRGTVTKDNPTGDIKVITLAQMIKTNFEIPKNLRQKEIVLKEIAAANANAKALRELLTKNAKEFNIKPQEKKDLEATLTSARTAFISGEIGINLLAAAKATAAKGGVSGFGAAFKDLIRKTAGAAGFDLTKKYKGLNELALARAGVKGAFQKLIPLSLGKSQTANSISNKDVGWLADAVINAGFLEDGSFSFAFVDDEALGKQLENGISIFKDSQRAALAQYDKVLGRIKSANDAIVGAQKAGIAVSAGPFGADYFRPVIKELDPYAQRTRSRLAGKQTTPMFAGQSFGPIKGFDYKVVDGKPTYTWRK